VAVILGELGFRVDVIDHGPDALQRLQHERFDLVVCDLRMPKVDGKTIYRRVSESKPNALAHFLFMTGDMVDPETRLFAENNNLRLVPKPFTRDELIQAVVAEFGSAVPALESVVPSQS